MTAKQLALDINTPRPGHGLPISANDMNSVGGVSDATWGWDTTRALWSCRNNDVYLKMGLDSTLDMLGLKIYGNTFIRWFCLLLVYLFTLKLEKYNTLFLF
ncbi:uncharacterized protein LOC122281103 [Carya illinoinensis]|uniref:uncharacterized protein LOC122281103 n=1 Tax=Carya illinoinensis TaxID=32201 RepID=UPI001C72599A|nr:uncharacterized protein LOC122281103 [Carya illinoinensis]